ncbi:sal-like protein 2 [Rhea pennata]|uniref:sal-like protein 2 n=1 Tax=Rhea pennata TaxID=8795 RepID=UPI002E265BFC
MAEPGGSPAAAAAPSSSSCSSEPLGMDAEPPPPPLDIPLLLEELRVLQQRQLHQLQLTEEICRQVLLLGAPAAPKAAPALFAAPKAEPPRAPASGTPPKPAFFHLYRPWGAKAEAAAFPAFPALARESSLRPRNEAEEKVGGGGRHRCRFCAKAFGSDSALQIHLRSHTGERPYKCNVCGNRFTTRGNLKVHFHRHRDRYPHVQMNPHPVPEHLDYLLAGRPAAPAEKSDTAEKPAPKAPVAAEGLPLLPQPLPGFGKLVLLKAAEEKAKGDENTPPGKLPAWALLANHFKGGHHHHHTAAAFPFLLEPLVAAPSETSKLQQLVEKIDPPGTTVVAAAATEAPGTAAAAGLPSSSVPNQCPVCRRVLSCPRALRLHAGQHAGAERPFRCKACGRAFSTRGNLRAHAAAHRVGPATAATAARPRNSCPICQKMFADAPGLQHHVRLHLGGQIPNGGPAPARQPEELSEEEDEEEEEEEEDASEEESTESGPEKPPAEEEEHEDQEEEEEEGEGRRRVGSPPQAMEGAGEPTVEEGGAHGREEAPEEPQASPAKENAHDGTAARKPGQAPPCWSCSPAPCARPPAPDVPPPPPPPPTTTTTTTTMTSRGAVKPPDFPARPPPPALSFWSQYSAFVAAGTKAARTRPAPAEAAAPLPPGPVDK